MVEWLKARFRGLCIVKEIYPFKVYKQTQGST